MKNRPPLQNPFEDIEAVIGQTAKQAVKSAGDTAKAAATDAKQQLTGEYPQQVEQGQPSPSGSVAGVQMQNEKKSAESKQNNLLIQTRKNIQNINQQLVRIRQEQAQKERETVQAEVQEKKQKKVAEEKKKEEPVWKRMLKGRTGTREASQRSAG